MTNSTKTAAPQILVVIVNFGTASLVIDCLTSLCTEHQALPGLYVVVTDNASKDDSVERLKNAVSDQGWQDWVDVMPLSSNGGFSYGNNAAIKRALASDDQPDLILLLNPDTIVRPDAIVHLVDYMDAHPEAAIIGSRLEDPDGTPQRSAFRCITPGSELLSTARLGLIRLLMPKWEVAMPARDKPHPADWLAGASMLIRRAVFEKIGYLDEDYFLYFEEVDFCLRARRAGFSCWYVPASRIVHLVGAATGISDTRAKAKRRPSYWFRSRHHYFRKNWGRIGAIIADLNWIIGMLIWRLRNIVRRKPDPDPPRFLRDFLYHSVRLRGIEQ